MKILPFSKTYEGRCVLDYPGMEVIPGKIYAVIGANGSGKSTFAKILSGILPADKKGKHVSGVAPAVRETAKGLGLSGWKTFLLLCNECVYPIISAYLMAFSRSIAEVGAVSMVGGAIAWKTNVMTTAIMQHTNRGNFTLGVALGIILLSLSLIVNILISLLQRRLSR